VAAASGASLSPFKGTPVLLSAGAVDSAVEAFSAAQDAWLLRGSRGLALHPGAAPSSLGASGRGFAVAVWFRVDDAGASNAAPAAVLQLTLAAGAASNVTLTLVSTVARGATVALVARRVGASVLLSDSDATVSSSSDDFAAASRPYGGLSSVGHWQHAVLSFGPDGVQNGLFWNGFAENITGVEAVYASTLFGSAPPYSLLGGAVGYDAQGSLSPLWGAVGDVQLYDFAVTQQMAHGLYTGHLDACIPLPSSKRGLTTGQTAGIVIGSFFGCTGTATLIIFHAVRKSKKIEQPPNAIEEKNF
jgi:hypothetical protein